MSDLLGNHIVGFPTRLLKCAFRFLLRNFDTGKQKSQLNNIQNAFVCQHHSHNRYVNRQCLRRDRQINRFREKSLKFYW